MINDTKNYPLGWDRSTETVVDVVPYFYNYAWYVPFGVIEGTLLEWLESQSSDGRFSWERARGKFVFEHPEDATMFLLRWS
jgi:hypothetical protein